MTEEQKQWREALAKKAKQQRINRGKHRKRDKFQNVTGVRWQPRDQRPHLDAWDRKTR